MVEPRLGLHDRVLASSNAMVALVIRGKKMHLISKIELKGKKLTSISACGVHNRTYAWFGTNDIGPENQFSFLKIDCEKCLDKMYPERRGK